MVTIGSLWLAILISAVLVFVVSGIFWMVLPHHKSDFSQLPDEDGAVAALRPQNLAPGVYDIPHVTDPKEVQNPDVRARFDNGPVGFLTVLPNGVPSMGKNLVKMFVYYLFVSTVVAYVVSRTMEPGDHYLAVFRVAGTVAWMAYTFGSIQDAIWFGKPWNHVLKNMADGFVYALLTAGAFGWQWPG
jgi:hypothetical protein